MSGVYLLLDPATQFVKIGRATDLETRLANLRTGNPRLSLLEWFETPHDSLVESYVHAKLVQYRKEGEFFDIDSESVKKEILAILELANTKPDKKVVEDVKAIENLDESREPNSEELNLVQKIIDLRAKIKMLETEEDILSQRLMLSINKSKGLNGWATFDGSSTSRFEAARFQLENPEIAKDYMKASYSRSLKIRPGMSQN
jgi:hypothetical protein